MTAAAVDGGDEPVCSDGLADPFGKLDVDRAVLEKRGREDDTRGSEIDERLRSFRRADAAADAAGKTWRRSSR